MNRSSFMRPPRSCRRQLLYTLDHFLAGNGAARILNIGAGQSLFFEEELTAAGRKFRCDRIDIDNCARVHPSVGNAYCCPVEDMASVPSGAYQAAFANFVLEHILDVDRAAKEIHRVLISGGLFATTLANPAAPEFVIAEHTPLWFHRLIKGGEVHATHYAYRSVADLVKRFEEAGFQLTEALYYTHVRGYLQRFPVLNVMGSLYDRLVEAFGLYGIMGAACLVFKKS